MSVNGELDALRFHGHHFLIVTGWVAFWVAQLKPTSKSVYHVLDCRAKRENVALVAARAFPRNCFQAPGQKGASPNIGVAWYYVIAWASQAT